MQKKRLGIDSFCGPNIVLNLNKLYRVATSQISSAVSQWSSYVNDNCPAFVASPGEASQKKTIHFQDLKMENRTL